MNLLLLDPFEVAKEYPETLTNSLQFGHSRYIKFNKKGDYLASGLLDGTICIFDNDTNQVITVLRKHTGVIQSILWSNCGRYILSASTDCNVLLWDLELQKVIREIIFESPVWFAQIHPHDPFVFIASILNHDPVYVDWHEEEDFKMLNLPTEKYTGNDMENESDGNDDVRLIKKRKKPKDLALCLAFAFDARYIFMGTSKGWLNIIAVDGTDITAKSFDVVYSQKITSSHVKQVAVSEKNLKIFVNCSDRIIRQLSIHEDFMNKYVKSRGKGTHIKSNFEPEGFDSEGVTEDTNGIVDTEKTPNQDDGKDETDNEEQTTDQIEFEIEHKYQDVINRLQWNSITTNHNGDYLIASTYGTGAHDIYMWETTMGSLIKVLEGPKEELFDIDWNNKRCCIGANGLDSGYVYLWNNIIPQKWSALAPDFVEIEENIEYEEREDEFDILPDEELNQRQLDEEDESVDIITKDQVDARGLEDEESFVIPVLVELEIEAPDDDDED